MRILHVTPYSGDAWAYGGIARLGAALARGLARRGHQVTVCATDVCDATRRLPGGPRSRARSSAWPPRLTSDNVEIRIFPNVSNQLAYRWQGFLPVGFARFMKDHARSFDVAHLHACRNLPGVIAAHHLRRNRVPYVLAPNGTAPRIERRLAAKRAFDAVAGQRVLDTASRVLAVSAAEERQLRAMGVPAMRIARIPNPVDLDEFVSPVPRGRFRARRALGDGPVVMFLGKVTPRKRLDLLVEAFARLRLPDASLVIAGNDMGGIDAARARVKALGVETRALFTGLLAGGERFEALADADVVVYPSEDEIFGLVPVEAILAGSPVIVADDSGCGEIIRVTGGGQVVPRGSVDALAAAIQRTLDAREQWAAAAADAAVRVRESFGADRVAERMEEMYRGMVA
jgi:glycosyltransferase involved in cell wall biosynthesis